MGIVILVLWFLRKWIHQKYQVKIMCMLWLFVAIRMLIPFQFNVSFIHPARDIDFSQQSVNIEFNNIIDTSDEIMMDDNQIKADTMNTNEPAIQMNLQENLIQYNLKNSVLVIWFVVALIMIGIHGYAYLSISNWLKRNSNYLFERDGIEVYSSDVVPEPLSFGAVKPKVYLNPELVDNEWVLSHELTHCKSQDGLKQWLMCIIKSLHWFNPCVYIMERLWETDREMACDEEVLKDKTDLDRMRYMITLYDAAEMMVSKRMKFTSGLLDGKSNIKERFVRIKHNTKRKKGIIAGIMLSLCVLLGGNLVGCTSKNTLMSQTISVLQNNMIEKMDVYAKYNKEIKQGYYVLTHGTISLEDQNEMSVATSGQKMTIQYYEEELSLTEDESDAAYYLQRIEEEKNQIQAELTRINQDLKQQRFIVEQVLESLNLKNKREFDIIDDDQILVKVTIRISEKDVLKLEFYESGQLVMSRGNGVVKNQKVVYTYLIDELDEIRNLVSGYNEWYWTEGPGGSVIKNNS